MNLDELIKDGDHSKLVEAFRGADPGTLDAAELLYRGMYAQSLKDQGDYLEAFRHFHWCITGKELSPYEEFLWVPEFIAAYREHRGVLLDCHRGSGKSFFLPAWILFVTWLNPVGSSQLVRLSDGAGAESDKAIAEIISTNPGWKAVAPNIIPDIEKGWSADGRYIIDTNVAGQDNSKYGEWSRKCYTDHGSEPNIMCAGVTSGRIIGKHPSNGQYFDDLHDESNTRSAREMQTVVDVVEKNIIPTWTRPGQSPTLGVACTLWSEKDAYHSMLKTKLFKHVRTPIYVRADSPFVMVGDEQFNPPWIKNTPIEQDSQGTEIISLWHDAYPAEKIRTIQTTNPVYFPLMYLCDLSAAKGKVLKKEWLNEYPHRDISPSWPTYFGIDFASTEDKLQRRDTDYFAISVWKAIPGGGAVLTGGFRGRLGSNEAVEKTKAMGSLESNLLVVGVERWGKGELFKNQLVYSSNLPIVPYPLQGAPVRSKGQRFQEGLAPMFTTGRAWISDKHDEFIDAFIDEWISWDGGKTATGHDDCLDAAYWGAFAAQGHLMQNVKGDELRLEPVGRRQRRDKSRKALSFGELTDVS